MLDTVYRYLYMYDGKEICIMGIGNKLSKRERIKQLKEQIIARYNDFNRKKLKFIDYKTIKGIVWW